MTEISEISTRNSGTSGQSGMNQQQQQQQRQQTADGRSGHGANSGGGGQQQQQQQSPQQQNAQHQQQQQQAQQHLVNAAGQTIASHAPNLANQSFITNTLGHNLSSPIYLQPSPLQYIYQLAPNMLANIPLQTSNNTLLQLPNTSSVALPANTGRQQNLTSRGVAMSPQQPSISTTAQGQTIGGFKTPDNNRLKFAQSPISSSSPILIPHGTALQMAPAGSCILPNNQKLSDQRGKIVLQQTPPQIQPKSSMIPSHGPPSLISTNLKPMTSSSMIHSQQSPLMNNQIPIMVGSNRIQLIQPNQLNQLNQPDSFVIQSPLGPAQIYLNPSALPVAMSNQSAPIISLATSQSHTATNTALTNASQGMTGQMIAPIPTSVPLSIHSTAPISTQSIAVAPPPSTVSTTTRPRQIKPAQIQASVGTQTAGGTSGLNTSNHSSATTTTPALKSGNLKTTKNAKLPFKSQADRGQQSIYRQISPSQGCVSAGQGSQTINVQAFPNQSHLPPNPQISSSTGLPSNTITSPHLSHSNPTESRPHQQMNKDNNVTVTLVSQSPMNQEGNLVTQRPPKTVPISRDISVETSKMTKTKEVGTNKPPGERLRGRPPTNKSPSNGIKERNQARKSDVESRDAFAGDNMETVNNFVDPIRENGMYMNREHFVTPIGKSNELSNGVSKEVTPKLPQKAIVKPFLNDPNVLTHVIDGYVIQESPSPFPLMDHNNSTSENNVTDSKDDATEDESTITDPTDASLSSSIPKPKSDSSCENCGKAGISKVGKGGKKKKQKRFCSKMCALKFNDIKKSQKLANEAQNISNTRESKPSTDYPMDDIEGLYIPAGSKDPRLWNVQDVCDFVRNLPGCLEYADVFKSHEIDGKALSLLNEDNLMHHMGMKLGPALKLRNRITELFKAENCESQA